jgi:multidrug efflux system outer membrane protein
VKALWRVVVPALLLTGCASAPPQTDVQLEMDVPAQWTAATTPEGPADSLWWRQFGDDKLVDLLEEAFTYNYNLKIAAGNLDAALARAKIAGASLYPQLNLGLDASRRKQNFIGLPVPGAEGGVYSTTNNAYGVSLNLSWELDLWGRLRAEKSSAVGQAQAAQADYWGAQLSLAGQVCKSWFAAIEAKRQVELAEATVENQRISYEQVRQRYRSGLTSSLDLRLAHANYSRAEAGLRLRKIQEDGALRQLEVLLGRYPDAEVDLSPDLPSVSGPVPAGLPVEILSRRPDLIAAERRLASSYSGVTAAKRALYPRISLTGSMGTVSTELGDVLNGNFSVWNVVGNILQPIFQGGRLRANVDLSHSRADVALAQYGLSVLNAFAEVEHTLIREQYLGEREVALAVAAEQSLAARALAEDQYNSGLRGFVTMLEAQRSAYDNESLLLTVRRERLDARIDLHLALGGDFVANDEPQQSDAGVEP